MKKLILASAVIAAFTASFAQAQDKKPEHEVSFNAAVVSDYRYRGISQTRLQPALQGGADYVHNPSGFYAGAWMSTVKWAKDVGGGGNLEVDLYAGKRGDLTKDITYDFGGLAYIYPSNNLGNVAGFVNANTFEVYGQLGYGPGYLKYSRSTTNLFGNVDSKGSGYWDAGANIEVATGTTLNLHVGHQTVAGTNAGVSNKQYDYTDWKVGVTKDFGVVTGALAYIATNAGEAAYTPTSHGKFLGKNALVLSVSKTF